MLDQAIAIIRDSLSRHGVNPKQLILFGSRARGDFHPDSDWDIFVVTERTLTFPEQQRLLTEIKRALARCHIPNDIVIRSEEQYNAQKDSPGVLSYYVAREGVTL